MTYKIVRFYQDGRSSRTIERGLTKEEAQRHCNDPKSSSQQAGKPLRDGTHWFDGWTDDK